MKPLPHSWERPIGRQCRLPKAVSALLLTAFLFTPAASLRATEGNPGDLSPDVQADVLRNAIVAAAKANDLKAALTAIDEYKKLKVEFPPALALVEAKAANQTGDAERALAALKVFLNHSERGSAPYKEALDLYPAYQRAAEDVEAQKRKVEAALKAERAAAQQRENARREQSIAHVKQACGDLLADAKEKTSKSVGCATGSMLDGFRCNPRDAKAAAARLAYNKCADATEPDGAKLVPVY
jgi:hypothetical protein